VIFVTVGTHHQPFERLLSALERLPEQELTVQFGTGTPPRSASAAAAFMGFDEVLSHLERARVVITHAGVGSILSAVRLGHTPIVVARRRRFGEHVDDHQAELTRALASRGGVVAVWDVATLSDALAAVPPRRGSPPASGGELAAAVRHALGPQRLPVAALQ